MKFKIGIIVATALAVISLAACAKTETKTPKKEVSQAFTTKDYQKYYNEIVDENLDFMQEIPKDNDVNKTVEKSKNKLTETKEIINQIEKRESKNDEAKNEVLALAKGYSNYYGLIAKGDIDKATTEITITLVSVPKVADRVFSGELPPKYESMK